MLRQSPRPCLEGAAPQHSSSQQEALCHALTFRLYGNKWLGCVPPLLFRVLLVQTELEINAEKVTLPECKTHPLWLANGPFKNSDLGTEAVDPWRGSAKPASAEWDGQSCASQTPTNEWAWPTIHPSSQTFFEWRVFFTRHGSPEGWVWIMAHQRRGLRSLMFIAWGLKCRESLWACQWSRKEKTSLVPKTISYAAFETAVSCPSSPHSHEALFKYEAAARVQEDSGSLCSGWHCN